MNNFIMKQRLLRNISLILIIALLAGSIFAANAVAQTRVVVLPFYVEEGAESKEPGYIARHYRRVVSFMNNQLVRHGFEVINPFAADLKESEYNSYLEKSRDDSALMCKEMCKRFATEIAYVVWLDVKTKTTSDGYCKAKARLDGNGYDSAARDLGANVSKTFKITRRDCDDAIAEVEKEVADLVGRKLTAWSGGGYGHSQYSGGYEKQSYGRPSYDRPSGSGVLQRNADKLRNLINVRLDGATDYEIAEIFGKVLNTVRGVVKATRFRSKIVPDEPQASVVIWRAEIENTDPFRLQANIMKMINDILDAGGEIRLKGVKYRYTAAEVDLLKGIRTGDSSSREIHFVIDRELSRDREFSGRHDPYKSRKKWNNEESGFDN
ncbi:Flagellar assembly protein T N-terminal domain-containing protein [Candidatus Magnetomoraceae bacterium gMMP-15]